MNLVIVESPVKSQTISKYLKDAKTSDTFKVIATGGHISDLDENSLSIEYRNGKFYGDFRVSSGKKDIINNIKLSAKGSDNIFICCDDDREGEKIADDVVNICEIKKYFRVTFTEITKRAIELALIQKQGIRLIDEKIVLAQWTRRMADRIIGYGLSPALSYFFSKNKLLTHTNKEGIQKAVIPRGTGRVIGISLSILVKRQQLIDKYNEVGQVFTDVVSAKYTFNGVAFSADGKGLEFSKDKSNLLNSAIIQASSKLHKVYSYNKEQAERQPYPPFTTASLYTACSYLYDFSPEQTKKIVQQLYETGYINYPRTDSVILSEDAIENIIGYLYSYLHEHEHDDILRARRVYKKNPKHNTQDAHEAIRPIYFNEANSPENISKLWDKNPNCAGFDNSHLAVYKLIWIRTLATQLKNSVYDTSSIEIKAGEFSFTAKAHDRLYDGWEKHFGEMLNDSAKGTDESEWGKKRVVLPIGLYAGLILEDVNVAFWEKSSRSPKRISEGALITTLVNLGIARPSTLHTISRSLKEKKYVTSVQTLLSVTDLGREVFNVTNTYLEWVNNIDRAKEFEELIHRIETGEFTDANALLKVYWDLVEQFKQDIGFMSASDKKPTDSQIKYANNIIDSMSMEEKEAIKGLDIFASQATLSNFIEKQEAKRKKDNKKNSLGYCPKCGKKSVISVEQGYKCYEKNCDFILWGTSIDKFFEQFKRPLKDRDKFVEIFLDKTPTKVENLISKTGDKFTAMLEPRYVVEYKKWQIGFANH